MSLELPLTLSIDTVTEVLRRHALVDFYDALVARLDAYSDPAVWIKRMSREHIAQQCEKIESRRGHPLFGVPFAVKDNIDLGGEPTTAACPDFAYTAPRSATAVRKLMNAGAICVGKTNLDQFATGLVGTRSPYGACRNVFDPRYISGGSSSGSAVAVAAGLASFSLGTDTAGSGRVPAGFNNIVGLKPTKSLVSAAGVVPACRTLDCVSIFGLSCADAAAVLDVIEGFDPADPYSRPEQDAARRGRPVRDTKIRFGVPQASQLEFFGNVDGEKLYRSSLDRISEIGGERIDFDYTPFDDTARLLYEGPWVAERVAAIHSFLTQHADALLPVTRGIYEGAMKWDAVSVFESMYKLQALRARVALQWEHMDLIVLPTAGTIYTIEEIAAEPIKLNSNLGKYTNFVNLLDLCAVAIPAGFGGNGLPFGVTLIAPAGHDDYLLRIGGRLHRDLKIPAGIAARI